VELSVVATIDGSLTGEVERWAMVWAASHWLWYQLCMSPTNLSAWWICQLLHCRSTVAPRSSSGHVRVGVEIPYPGRFDGEPNVVGAKRELLLAVGRTGRDYGLHGLVVCRLYDDHKLDGEGSDCYSEPRVASRLRSNRTAGLNRLQSGWMSPVLYHCLG